MAANFIGRVDHLESIELDQELSEHFTAKIKNVRILFIKNFTTGQTI